MPNRAATRRRLSRARGSARTEKATMSKPRSAAETQHDWAHSPRWKGITRHYSAEDVARLGGAVRVEHTLARLGAERLWERITTRPPLRALGALTGNHAVEMVASGLQAIYL